MIKAVLSTVQHHIGGSATLGDSDRPGRIWHPATDELLARPSAVDQAVHAANARFAACCDISLTRLPQLTRMTGRRCTTCIWAGDFLARNPFAGFARPAPAAPTLAGLPFEGIPAREPSLQDARAPDLESPYKSPIGGY
jgi:hypothetical protein